MQNSEKIMIKVQNLNSLVHKNLNWDLKKNEIHGIIGPSGEGKSFFVKILLNLLPYQSGEIFDSLGNKWNLKEQNIAAQFQHSGLLNDMTIHENIIMPLMLKHDISKNIAEIIAIYYMNIVKLPLTCLNYLPSQCSGGMQKRAALAKALILKPEILFLDEPTAGLDPVVMKSYDELLLNISKTVTICIITHDIKRLSKIASRISIMIDGSFVTGSFDELKNHQIPKIKEFMNV